MISVEDVLAHIVQEVRANAPDGNMSTAEDILAGLAFNIRISITTDVEETEADYLDRFGKGYTFYFRLANYEHGRILAGQIYWIMLGQRPDLSLHTGEKFGPDEKLYLFVHVTHLTPPPLN